VRAFVLAGLGSAALAQVPGAPPAQVPAQAVAPDPAPLPGSTDGGLPRAAGGPATRGDASAGHDGDSLALPRATIVAPRVGPRTEAAAIAEIDTSPVAQTPLALGSIDAADIKRFGAKSLSDAIRLDASVADSYNTFGYIESLQIRGFVLDETLNYRRNGLPVSNHAPVALDNLERLELLKGVTGILAGSSTPGGMVNLVTRRPPDDALRSVTLGLSERGTTLAQGELGGRFGVGAHRADDAFGWRINLVQEQRRPNARAAPGSRTLAAVAFDYRGADGARLDVELESNDVHQISVPGFALLDRDGNGIGETVPSPRLAAFSPRANLNDQAWSAPFVSRSLVGSVRWQQPISPRWLWAARFGLQRIDTDDRIAFPDGCSSGPTPVYPGLCGNGDVDIYDFRSLDERRRLWAADVYVEGRFTTGGLDHGLRAGLRGTRYLERLPPFQTYNFAGTSNVYLPTAVPAAPDPLTPNTDRDLRLSEAYLFDAMRLGERWSAWWGARATRISSSSVRSDGAEAVQLGQGFVTPWVALGARPWRAGLVYLSAASGVETQNVPQRPADFANAGATLPAQRSRQIELGVKQGLGRDGLVTVALFSIRRPAAESVPQAVGLPLLVAGAREERHRGGEAAVQLQPLPQWRFEANATYLIATVVQSQDPALIGARAPNVPRAAGALSATWTPPQAGGWSLTQRLTASGSRAVTSDQPVRLPGYAQWDIAARVDHRWGELGLRWQFGIENVLDRRAWREAPTQPWGGVYLFPLAPRTVSVTLTATY
jgi:iron complex outermembrane receptor protein